MKFILICGLHGIPYWFSIAFHHVHSNLISHHFTFFSYTFVGLERFYIYMYVSIYVLFTLLLIICTFSFICPHISISHTFVCKSYWNELFGGRYLEIWVGFNWNWHNFCAYSLLQAFFTVYTSSLILQIITLLFACGIVRLALIGNTGQHWHRYFPFICKLIRFCSHYLRFQSFLWNGSWKYG